MKNIKLFMDGIQQGYRATTRDSLLFTTQSPGVPGTHLINFGGMKGWNNLDLNLAATHSFKFTVFFQNRRICSKEIS